MTSSTKKMPRIEESADETEQVAVPAAAKSPSSSRLAKMPSSVVKAKPTNLGPLKQPMVFLCAALGLIVVYLMREVQKLGEEVIAIRQLISRPIIPKMVAEPPRPAPQKPVPEKRVSMSLPDSTIIFPKPRPAPPASPVIDDVEDVDEGVPDDDESDQELAETLPQPPVEESSRKKRSKRRDASSSS